MADSEHKKDGFKKFVNDTKRSLGERSPVLRTMYRSHDLMRVKRVYDRYLPAMFLLGVLGALLWYSVLAPPPEFEAPAIVKVAPGSTLTEAAAEFEQTHAIRSAWTMKLLMRIVGRGKSVEAGSYFFSAPQDMLTVAVRLARGDFELTPVRITIREGESVQDVAADLKKKLAPFDVETFLNTALPREGYLYPDTYYFLPGEDPYQVEGAMETNFQNHILPIADKIKTFGKPLADVVNLASILVGEANTDHDRRVVAGILWKRIQIGMPLQVDATFGYIFDKNLWNLTATDVHVNSPYNTYQHTGLPPTPINNPDALAILQAVTPIKTNYLFYLSDVHGNMHYSATYAGQKANVRRYYGK